MRSRSDLGRSAATNVPGLMRWICTNDEKIRTSLQPAVPGAGGQYYDVTGLYGEFVSIWSTQHEAGLPVANPKTSCAVEW